MTTQELSGSSLIHDYLCRHVGESFTAADVMAALPDVSHGAVSGFISKAAQTGGLTISAVNGKSVYTVTEKLATYPVVLRAKDRPNKLPTGKMLVRVEGPQPAVSAFMAKLSSNVPAGLKITFSIET